MAAGENQVVSEAFEDAEPSPSGCKMGHTAIPDFAESEKGTVRVEIDTSAPFESVKEATTRFGGMGFWRPASRMPSSSSSGDASEHGSEIMDVVKLEEEAAEMQKDLIAKEREALDVLKELGTTKLLVEELKGNLQKETSDVSAALDDKNANPAVGEEKENHIPGVNQSFLGGLDLCPSSPLGLIFLELKQAKLNLTRTTNDLADIRATVESYNKKIEEERTSLEKTHQRLSSNSLKVSALEEQVNLNKDKLQMVKCAEGKVSSDDPVDIARELQRLSSETGEFKKVGEAARSVLRAMSDIGQAKIRIKSAEIRLVEAKKMKEAARAAEVVALAEVKALSNSENSYAASQQKPEVLTITLEEYSSLMSKVREAEEASQRGVVDAMLQVDEANVSKNEILKKVEEAIKEVKISKMALEEALNRVEAANRAKLAVEEALRKWRSERGQRRRSLQNSTKFKNSYSSQLRKDHRLLDVNGLNSVNDELKPVLKPALSIGQILSRKLLLTEEYENGMNTDKNKRKVSLAQMLGKHGSDLRSTGKGAEENAKQLPAKRKKLGLARISLLVTNQSKKKKKRTATSKCCNTI